MVASDGERHRLGGVVVTRSELATWIALSGELDLFRLGHFQDALAAVTLTAAVPVQLDLTRLAFCDVGGVRLLLSFIATAEQNGHPVRTVGARPMVRRLARLIANGRVDVAGPFDPR